MPGKYKLVKARCVKAPRWKANQEQTIIKLILTCDHKLTFSTSINRDHQVYKMNLSASPVRPTTITITANFLDLGHGRVLVPRSSLIKVEGDGDYVNAWRNPMQGELTLSPISNPVMGALKAIEMETRRLRLPVKSSWGTRHEVGSRPFSLVPPFDGGVHPCSFDQLSSRLNGLHLNGKPVVGNAGSQKSIRGHP